MNRISIEKISELKLLDPSNMVFSQLVQIFTREVKARIPEMKNYISHRDLEGLSKTIHRFRSTAYNLGANRAAEITKHIDVVIENGFASADELNLLISELEKECAAAHKELIEILTAAAA